MEQKLKLTKIVLTPRGGRDVELTINEARDLYMQLAELFAPRLMPTQPVVIDRYPPAWAPYQPFWISSPSADYPQNLPYVTCQAPSGLHTRYMGDVVNL
jgi:hypothetical protein